MDAQTLIYNIESNESDYHQDVHFMIPPKNPTIFSGWDERCKIFQ